MALADERADISLQATGVGFEPLGNSHSLAILLFPRLRFGPGHTAQNPGLSLTRTPIKSSTVFLHKPAYLICPVNEKLGSNPFQLRLPFHVGQVNISIFILKDFQGPRQAGQNPFWPV